MNNGSFVLKYWFILCMYCNACQMSTVKSIVTFTYIMTTNGTRKEVLQVLILLEKVKTLNLPLMS